MSSLLTKSQHLNSTRKNRRKRELLAPYVEGDVLHLGCRADGFRHEGVWLHEWLSNQADHCVGVDIDEESVKEAQKRGFDIKHGDVESINLGQTFDTVIATNIIEHLTCPGAMLDRASEHMTEDSRLIITTPRTFVPWTLARELKGGIQTPEEHVMWFCRDTLSSMLERHGFNVVNYESWGWRRVGTVWYEELFHTVENALSRVSIFESITDYQHFFVASK